MPELPGPVTVADKYLRAIHGVLGEIRDRLPEPRREPEDGTTVVSEPAKTPAKKTAGRGPAAKTIKETKESS